MKTPEFTFTKDANKGRGNFLSFLLRFLGFNSRRIRLNLTKKAMKVKNCANLLFKDVFATVAVVVS